MQKNKPRLTTKRMSQRKRKATNEEKGFKGGVGLGEGKRRKYTVFYSFFWPTREK